MNVMNQLKSRSYFGDLIINEVRRQNLCKVKFNIQGHDIAFKLDTEAGVFIIGYDLRKELNLGLCDTNEVLLGPEKTRLKVVER